VRQIDRTTWECTACGEQVHIKPQKPSHRPTAMLLTVTGRPRERLVTVGDEIVHRCVLGVDYDEGETQGSHNS
jgi:hypothetical protein